MPQPDLAVLTGDVIKSSRLAPGALDAVMAALASGAASMSGWPGAVPARFTRFRGDGWQCLAPSPAQALRAALFLRAHVRALKFDADTRVAVGLGPGDPPESGDLAAAGGSAFEVSGRGLDAMGRAQQFTIGWSSPPPASALVGAVFALADEISRLWTPPQAEVLMETLSPGETAQRELADKRGVSQQAIAQRLSAGGDWAIRRALSALEGGE